MMQFCYLLCLYYYCTPNQGSITTNMSTSALQLTEIDGDLFTAPKDTSLGHCVGGDMAMGAGIAVVFRQTFKKVDELLAQKVQTGGVAVLKDNDRYIYYMVTKPYSYGKPTYESLSSSLAAMRDHMRKNNVKNLALPRIGCGIDGLQWEIVKPEIAKVFQDEDVSITIYNFVPK